MDLKPKPGAVRVDRHGAQASYTTTVMVLYDPEVDLYFLADSDGSTTAKLTPSELEEEHGAQGKALHKRFQAALAKGKKSKPKKATKKGAKKGAKKAAKNGKSKLAGPPGAVAVPDTGKQRIVLDAAGGKLTISKDYKGETGWRYKDQWGEGPVWIREPFKGGDTWEIVLLDGSTRDLLELEEAEQLGIYIPPRLRDRPAPKARKKGLMQRLFGK